MSAANTQRAQSASRGGDPVRPAAAAQSHEDGHPLAALHEAFGNLGVLQRLAEPSVQAKLEVGAPGDDYEREADAVAATVMRRPEAGSEPPQIRRRAEDDDKKKPSAPQRPAGAAAKAPPAPKPPPAKAPEPPKPAPPKAAAAPKQPETPTTIAGTKQPPKPAEKKPAAKTPPKPKAPEKKKDDHTVAAKAAPGAVPSVPPAAARTIQTQQGAGQPLPAGDRTFFESGLGRDLGAVRVHDDAAARSAAREIQAQAFTYGQDIYFAAGRYQPGTASGRELLAHELAHTIQQRPGAPIGRRVQRQPTTPPAQAQTTAGGGGGATAPPAAAGGGAAPVPDPLPLGTLGVPGFRLNAPGAAGDRYRSPSPPLRRSRNYTGSRTTDPATGGPLAAQRDVWRTHMTTNAQGLQAAIRQMQTAWQSANHDPHREADTPQGQLVVKSNATNRYVIGDLAYVTGELSLPDWDDNGATSTGPERGFQVDHILELQLTDFPDHRDGHAIGNFQLLRASINTSSGPTIDAGVDRAVLAYLGTLPPTVQQTLLPAGRTPPATAADAGHIKQNHNLTFTGAVASAPPANLQARDFWSKEAVEAGTHLSKTYRGRPIVEITSLAELGGHGGVAILPRASGGHPTRLTTGTEPGARERNKFAPLRLVNKQWNVGPDWATQPQLGRIALEIPPGHKSFEPMSVLVPVTRFPGAQFAGHLGGREGRGTDAAINQILSGLRLKRASPVIVEETDLGDEGMELGGHITTDLPLISGASLDFAVRGEVFELSKTFATSDFHVPPPLHIDSSSLTLGVRSSGELFAHGEVDASIDRFGSGFLRGGASTEHGFSLVGGFDARSDLFQPAHIELGYQDGQLSGRGTIGIGAGKVPGVSRAQLDVSYAEGHLAASGTADFTIPGVRSGEVHLDYDQEHGLTIGGTVTLASLPGIREGTISATIAERPGGAGYKLSAHGSATAGIPGFEAQLTVDYDDGAFFAQASLPIHRGLLDGSVELGATNRPVDEQGRPVLTAAPLPDVAIFGSGTATLQITPWLRGTAGVRLLPNGEIEVDGALTVPGVNLWDEIAPPPRPLFHPPSIEFPIFGPVVLSIGGSLNLEYGISAGVLSGSLSVHYNPSHEDLTRVHGDLHLHASAFAGLELDIDVTIGLDAIVGSISGGIELGAEVRADAAIDPSIAIDWTPSTGFSIDPVFEASLTPKLVFHLRAIVTASLAFWSKTWRKDLAQREFGSGMQLGVRLPVHYQEGQPFAMDWSRLTFTHPDIDPLETAKNFLEELV